jgi:hypothetical protein
MLCGSYFSWARHAAWGGHCAMIPSRSDLLWQCYGQEVEQRSETTHEVMTTLMSALMVAPDSKGPAAALARLGPDSPQGTASHHQDVPGRRPSSHFQFWRPLLKSVEKRYGLTLPRPLALLPPPRPPPERRLVRLRWPPQALQALPPRGPRCIARRVRPLAGGPILKSSRLESGRNPTRKLTHVADIAATSED